MRNGTLDRYIFDGGYFSFSNTNIPTCHYYNRDHLGNIREVIAEDGTVEQVTHYYPFGTQFSDGSGTGPDVQPYKYNGKEFDAMHGLNTYDYGARQYDPLLAVWHGVDPLCEKDYGTGATVYCRNNPVRAIDAGGCEVIFVNGYIGFGSPPAGASYWNGLHSGFVQGASHYFNDRNIVFLPMEYRWYSSAADRMNDGYKYAKANLISLTKNIKNNETINFVTHSMGAAFAEGMASYFIEQGFIVAEMIHINAFQADDITTIHSQDNSTFTTDYQNTDDWVINKIPFLSSPGDIHGADSKIRRNSKDPNKMTRHRSPIDKQGANFWKTLKDKQKDEDSFTDIQ